MRTVARATALLIAAACAGCASTGPGTFSLGCPHTCPDGHDPSKADCSLGGSLEAPMTVASFVDPVTPRVVDPSGRPRP